MCILLYKNTFTHLVGHCMYTPTCSMYTYDAIDKYGSIRGLIMGISRILRCHPLAKGGFDPVRENLRGNAKWTL
ncbi:MAG: membrane protein insertion efficiency factor YidD [Christensenellaceae bacterium]|nr:membrane protein insertion efficiency factor YidD [Christensenellaceae bacterium]